MRMEEKIDKAVKYMQQVAISQGRDWVNPTEIDRYLAIPVESKAGSWCRTSDYQKLQAENTRLVMLNAATEAECDKFMELSAELVDLLEACIAGETVYTNGFVRIIKDALNKAREVME